MKFEHLTDFYPSKNFYTKFTKMNNIIEIVTMQKKNNTCPIKKLNNNEYVLLESGEILTCNHIENRSQNIKSVVASISNLRNLINNNFNGGKNELFVTLTFGENKVYNPIELCPIFEKFIKRLRYAYKDLKLDYIYVGEPHLKGDWHIHLLLKADKDLYIKNSDLANIWGHGFVKVNRLQDVDNIGAYVSSYLTNLKDGENTIKGARLFLYPPNHQLYRCSKDIKKPVSISLNYENAKKKVGSAKPTFTTTIKFTTDDGFTNIVHKEFFNLSRLN